MGNQQIKAKAAEHKQKQDELNQKFWRIFNSDDGKVVFEHLFQTFIMRNETPLDSANIEYEAGYHAGESGVVKYISQRMSNSQR